MKIRDNAIFIVVIFLLLSILKIIRDVQEGDLQEAGWSAVFMIMIIAFNWVILNAVDDLGPDICRFYRNHIRKPIFSFWMLVMKWSRLFF